MSLISVETVLIISGVLVGVAAVAAAVFALLALLAWRKHLTECSERKIAKDFLKAAYRVREAFQCARDPAISLYDFPEDMRSPLGDLFPEREYDGLAWVYKNRLEKIDISFRELEELNLQAQVEWGPEVGDRILELRYCRIVLFKAIDDMLWDKKNPDRPKMSEDDLLERDSIIYQSEGSDADKLTSMLGEAFGALESWLRPIVRAEG